MPSTRHHWLIRPIVLAVAIGSPLSLGLSGCGPATPAPVVQTGSETGPVSPVDSSKVKTKTKSPSKIDVQ